MVDLAKKFEDYGVEAIIYTDIGRDGMLTGVNIEATVKLARALTVPVIATGGVSNLSDVRACASPEQDGHRGRDLRARDLPGRRSTSLRRRSGPTSSRRGGCSGLRAQRRVLRAKRRCARL